MADDDTRAAGLKQASAHVAALALRSKRALREGATGDRAVYLSTEAAVLEVVWKDLRDMAANAERAADGSPCDADD